MQVSKLIPRSALAAVAAVLVAAPAAVAVPLYDGDPPQRATTEAYDVNRQTGEYIPADASGDMHASTVGKTAYETTVTGGDLRTEATKSPIQSTLVDDDLPGGGDLRSEHAKTPIQSTLVDDDLPGGGDLRSEHAKAPGVTVTAPPVGMPTWPRNPVPVVTPEPVPVQATDGDGGSSDWPLAGLIAGGAIALLGAALIASRQLRPAH